MFRYTKNTIIPFQNIIILKPKLPENPIFVLALPPNFPSCQWPNDLIIASTNQSIRYFSINNTN